MCSPLRRAFFLLPLVLLAAPPALGAPRWTPPGPFGGTIRTLSVAPSDARVIFATTPYEERTSQAYIVYDMALDPEEPRRVYAATSSGVRVLEDEP